MYDGEPTGGTLALVVDNREECIELDFWERAGEGDKVLFRRPGKNNPFVPIDPGFIHGHGEYSGFGLSREYQKVLEKAVRERGGRDRAHTYLQRGKSRFILLINSLGGSVLILNEIRGLMSYIRRRAGSVAAYGGDEIASAGAEMFIGADPDKRFCLCDSRLLFHVSDVARHVPRMKERQWKQLRQVLIENTIKDKRSEIATLLDHVKKADAKPQLDVVMSGEEAQDFGLAQIPNETNSLASLEENFCAAHGIDPKNYEGTAIESFFAKAAV